MESMTVQVLLTELQAARQSLDRAVACLVPVRTTPLVLKNEPLTSPKFAPRKPTIKFVTQNGFAIERLCEREEFITDSAIGCHFIVRGPDDEERCVTVAFSEAATETIQRQRSVPLPLDSPYWLDRAERCLVTYLWEQNEYPSAGRLTIDQWSLPVF